MTQLTIVRLILVTFLVAFHAQIVFAGKLENNKDLLLKGKVVHAETGEPIAFAAVYIPEIVYGTLSDNDGFFSIQHAYKGAFTIKVSSIGFRNLEVKREKASSGLLVLSLQPMSYHLDEVVVAAREIGNSTSLIEKTAMQHIQPSSLGDLMQLLPGHSTKEINLSKPDFIAIRQAGSDQNTSLGTSFVVDGVPLSNEANLQEIYGASRGSGSTDELGTRLTTSSGIDMRTISTDKIESVEVVRGIPSARYGDLTAGLVKIELKTGKTPWEGRAKIDLKNRLFSIGKGLQLPARKGLINFDLDYADYKTDPRSALTNYTRTTGALRYENTYTLSESLSFNLKGNISYTGSFDDVKVDPDASSEGDYLKTIYNSLSVSSRGRLNSKGSFIRQVAYSIGYTNTEDRIKQQKEMFVGGATPMITAGTEAGSFETGFMPARYTSFLRVNGNPVALKASLDVNSFLKVMNTDHSFLYGLSYHYDKNRGAGQLYDLRFPPYRAGTTSTRPRAFSDVPALKKLSFYLEDNMLWKVGRHRLSLSPGIRFTSMLGVGEQYTLDNKIYAEPRVNAKWSFPAVEIGGEALTTALSVGWGRLYKFPTMAQLYPDRLYFDYVELNYYSTSAATEAFSYAQVRTFIEDRSNYDLVPAKNIKQEIGFTATYGKIRLDLTFFREDMKNGFSYGSANGFRSDYVLHDYTYYEAESVKHPLAKPGLDEFESRPMVGFTTYSKTRNNAGLTKKGLEYTLNLGKINPLYTEVLINGAWFRTHYTYDKQMYYYPGTALKGDPYPYIGVYDYNANNEVKSQFNTNVNFNSHIPFLRMIFSTSIQTMWYETDQPDVHAQQPVAYITKDNAVFPFSPELVQQTDFKDLLDTKTAYYFLENKKGMASKLNVKLSKEIGDRIRLACYFNNLLYYMPDYTHKNGLTIGNRTAAPYFGAELNIKL